MESTWNMYHHSSNQYQLFIFYYSSSTQISFNFIAFKVLRRRNKTTKDKIPRKTKAKYLNKISSVWWDIKIVAIVIAESGNEYAHHEK